MSLDISVIIPSFNTKKLLRNCLESVFLKTKKAKFEVIVVDNASSDGSPQMIRKEYPKVKLISLKKNCGFGKANNLGAKCAKGEWLLFLNSDAEIKNSAIDIFFKNTGRWKLEAGSLIIGCKLLNPDGSIQPSAGYFPTLWRVFLQMFFIDDLPLVKSLVKPYQQNNAGFYQEKQEVDWVTGAFLMVKKKAFDKINGFDEAIFMYAEEIDFCYRLKQLGAKVLYFPRGEVIHHKGGSSFNGFESAVLGEYKGLIGFFKKNYSSWQIISVKSLLYLGALLRIVIFGMIDRRKAEVYFKAMKKLI